MRKYGKVASGKRMNQESERTRSQMFAQKVQADKIAYEHIMITFEGFSFFLTLPCTTRHKVNIKIMHFLWPVITAERFGYFLEKSIFYSTNSYHISNFVLKLLFIQIMQFES